jgi:arylsulfatase A-like enzyme
MSRPNVLYIHSHDTGRYIQPYGFNVPTPSMQALAEQGVLFREAFCGGPTCSASRAALLTGQCCHSSGMIGLAHRGFSLADPDRHITHTLKAVGYRTALCGVQHVISFRDDSQQHTIAYDERLDMQRGRGEDVTSAAVSWLRDAPDGPWFLSVGFGETHRTFRPAGLTEDARYMRPPLPLPDTPRTRADMADFCASARAYDHGVGEVIRALDAAGLAENTLVINTTDHGIAFPSMKCNLTQHGTGVMLIMRGPGGFAGGHVLDSLVSHVDVFPTVCEVCDVQPPAWLQGTSLVPLVRGEADEVSEEVYSEVTYHAAYEPMRSVRTKRWNYIRRYDGRTAPVLPNCDESPSKDVWLEAGWADRAPAEEQLYDLVFDPVEVSNLAVDPQYADVLAEMRGRLQAWMERTDDPILRGLPVPAPKGAKVNDPDGLSPREQPRVVQ